VDPIAAHLFLAQCGLLEQGLITEVAVLQEKFGEEERGEDRTQHIEQITELALAFKNGKEINKRSFEI